MSKEVISTSGGPSDAPYSPAVRVNGLLYTSGQVGIDKENNNLPSDIAGQTHQCLENQKEILDEAGASLNDVVKVNVYLTDMSDFSEMNEVYREYFPANPPARAAVGVAELADPKFKIEVELIADVS